MFLLKLYILTHFFPMHPFSTPLKTSENHKVFWCFQGVEKGCIGNEWVKNGSWVFSNVNTFYERMPFSWCRYKIHYRKMRNLPRTTWGSLEKKSGEIRMNLDGNIFFVCNKYNRMIRFTLLERRGLPFQHSFSSYKLQKWLSVNYFNPEYFPWERDWSRQ